MTQKKALIIAGVILVAVIGAYLIKYISINRHSDPVVDIFQILVMQGYTPNSGFSGLYQPGAVIQTNERGPDGQEKTLTAPLLFLRGESCFPGKTPMQTVYALPDSTGKTSASLKIGAKLVEEFLPSLALDSSVVADHSLKFDNPHILAFAKGDLSHQFSQSCLRSFERELRAGGKMEWFSVIQEVVAVDALNMEIKWKSGTKAEERVDIRKKLQKSLSKASADQSAGGITLIAQAGVSAEDDRKTVLLLKGPVVIAYRARPLYPVKENQ